MKGTGISFASRRMIEQSTFSSPLSSKRLERVQSLLQKSSNDALLTILGIDSRYNEGCRQLANYLLFGFYNLPMEEFNEVEISEEDVEDLVIVIRQTSIAVYCCSSLYHYVLPYITNWKNLEIHCLRVEDQDERDEDEKEEFKIKSLVSMLHGSSRVAVPYSTNNRSVMADLQSTTFSPLVIEKWPLIQSYALEDVGKGQFFTMQFNVTNIQESLITLYKECDPANLEKILIKSLPLLERHWNETVEFVKGTNNKELQVASTELNESEVAESLASYFSHGRLSTTYRGESEAMAKFALSKVKPFVCFGKHTQQFEKYSSSTTATLENSGTKRRALHMIIQGIAPLRPLFCCRTYFLSASDAEGNRDLDLLVSLYMECIQASRAAISEYKTCDSKAACVTAKQVLSAACSSYCSSATSNCKIEVLDSSRRVVSEKQSNPRYHITKVMAHISGIKNADGELLGSVCYADTFMTSKLHLFAAETNRYFFDTNGIVLTSGIPTCVQWNVGNSRLSCEASSFLAKIPGVYVCSNSPAFGEKSCDIEIFSDKSLIVRHQYIAPFLIPGSAIEKFTMYKPETPNTVALLQVIFKSSSKLPWLSEQHSSFAFAFFPQTTAWKQLSNVVEFRLKQRQMFSVDQIDPSLAESYDAVQASYSWIAGLIYRSNPKVRSYKVNQAVTSLQPQLISFLRHYSSSFILGEQNIPAEDVDELLKREDSRADNVASVAAAKPKDSKICVSVVCGLPGSHADRICASLVALHKEKVRWVVAKVVSLDGNACIADEAHLQDQLKELVSKKQNIRRPGVASSLRLRIIVEAVGFYNVSAIVSCIINHNNKSVRDQMSVGAVTTCVEPLVCHIDHAWLFPNVLEQCIAGVVSNIAFTGVGVLEDIKDKNLAEMQGMIRSVNHGAAFLLAPSGHVQRAGDFDLILSESSFETKENRATRVLSVPGLWKNSYMQPQSTLPMCEVKLDFSQPLLKGTLCARLRALRHNLHPAPFTGNVYMVQGVVQFTEHSESEEASNLCFVTRTGSLHIEPRLTTKNTPAPPTSRGAPLPRPYHLKFYGVGLFETELRDWLRKSGRQAPTRKSHRSRESLSQGERKKIQTIHQQDSLPEGVFFNGSQYCSLADNSKSYEHPCIEKFIDDYLKVENEKIDAYNQKLKGQMLPDMFDNLK